MCSSNNVVHSHGDCDTLCSFDFVHMCWRCPALPLVTACQPGVCVTFCKPPMPFVSVEVWLCHQKSCLWWFEPYCHALLWQGIVPEGEWEDFVDCLRRPLPITFRINGSGKFANQLRGEVGDRLFKQFKQGPITVSSTSCLLLWGLQAPGMERTRAGPGKGKGPCQPDRQ